MAAMLEGTLAKRISLAAAVFGVYLSPTWPSCLCLKKTSLFYSDVANLIIGGGHIFIYSNSQTIKTIDLKKINCAEHEYINMCPPPTQRVCYVTVVLSTEYFFLTKCLFELIGKVLGYIERCSLNHRVSTCSFQT